MWPMTDAEAVLFMIAVALRAVGGAGAGGRVMAATNTIPLASGLTRTAQRPGWLDKARAFDSAHRSSA